MYEEILIDHPAIYSFWRAKIFQTEVDYSENANYRWGFVFHQSKSELYDAYVVGPSAQLYNFNEQQLSEGTFWGVELHETIESDFIDKSRLQGKLQKLTTQNNILKIGENFLSIPNFERLQLFVEELMNKNIIRLNYKIINILNDKSHLSQRTHQRIIREKTGLTMKQIQLLKKTEIAIPLLRQSVPHVNIAVELDFFDQSHFSKVIKRMTGKSPSYYSN